jgi:hypothetical protein
MIRPARLGLMTVKPSVANVCDAATAATSAWGGIYFPIIDIDRSSDHVKHLEELSVDAVWPLKQHPLANELAKQPGFRWHTIGSSLGPFDFPGGAWGSGLLGSDWLLEQTRTPITVVEWSNDDPLNGLYRVWFGCFDAEEYRVSPRGKYSDKASLMTLKEGQVIPPIMETLTPVSLTAEAIQYTGNSPGVGIVVVDPAEPADLLHFWNLRARGAHVIPWPIGYEHAIELAASQWVDRLISEDRLPKAIRGDGTPVPPYLNVWTLNEMEIPTLQGILKSRGIAAAPGYASPGGWNDRHPFITEFRKTFQVEVEARAISAQIPLPLLPWKLGRRASQHSGVVVADLDISSEDGLDPERTMVIPRVRRLATLMGGPERIGEPFQRPNGEGGAYALRTTSDTIRVSLTHPLDIIRELFGERQWTFSQSDPGRFSERLSRLFGGGASGVANQPAVREVLLRVAQRSEFGIKYDHLMQIASKNRGDWRKASIHAQTEQQYARNLLLGLTNCKLLRIFLPLTCPQCRNSFVASAEELATEIQCGFCDYTFPLAFAIASAGPKKSDWHYRLAGHVAEFQIRAALSTLTRNFTLAPAQVVGVELKVPGGKKAEFDVAAIVDPFVPEIVIGEVKGHVSIDQKDIDNLTWTQSHLAKKQIRCFILVATFKDALTSAEQLILRTCCEQIAEREVSRDSLMLPIILTNRELSVPFTSDEHPRKWAELGQPLSSVGLESCKRNLGLVGVEIVSTEDGWYCELAWDDRDLTVE